MVDQTKKVDFDLIRAAMDKQPKFKAAMRVLAARIKGRFELSYSSLRRDLLDNKIKDWTPGDYQAFFTMLQKAGAGSIVHNKEEQPRFMWEFYFPSVAAKALGLPSKKPKLGFFDKSGLPPAVVRRKTQLADITDAHHAPAPTLPKSQVIELVTELFQLIDPKGMTSDITHKYSQIITLLSKY